ncbi:MAG TPA: amidohydrolase [Synergistaceae bacterium]|nr:amidohydrolase [Synergistaceae bacterium]
MRKQYENLLEDAQELQKHMVELRRDFHRHPEVAFEEHRTAEKVEEELRRLGLEPMRIGGTGVMADIRGKSPGKTLALRADMDALEVEEETGLEFASSRKGYMHACGHDAHTATLLGAAALLVSRKEDFAGTLRLIFQPAEENVAGAEVLVREGVLQGVDAIFGQHIWASLESGKVSIEEGPRMAGADRFTIHVKGKGGHAGLPHETVDAAVVTSAIVLALQSIVSREMNPQDPVVISMGEVRSGSRYNVIADKGFIDGTVRTFNEEVRRNIPHAIRRIAENTARVYRAEAEVEYVQGVPVTKNDPAMAALARESARKILGENCFEHVPPVGGAEDFSRYVERIPGAFGFFGGKSSNPEASGAHHHPKFDIDESRFYQMAALYAQVGLDYLEATE